MIFVALFYAHVYEDFFYKKGFLDVIINVFLGYDNRNTKKSGEITNTNHNSSQELKNISKKERAKKKETSVPEKDIIQD